MHVQPSMNKRIVIPNALFFEQVERWLAEGGRAEIPLRGYSMRPLLRDGRDVVILEPYRGEVPKVGEVYLFRYRGQHILHRLHRIEASTLTMAGDGNYHLTEQCTAADLVGLMTGVRRRSGRVVGCDSKRWRWQSALWCALPALMRRIILGVLWRMGIR